MRTCSAITAAGSRCKNRATTGSDYCPAHDPTRREARREAARKAGRARGRGGSNLGEVREAKQQIRSILGGLLRGQIPRDLGGVLLSGYNTLARFLELERKIKETEDLEARIERLEELREEDEKWAAGT